MQNEQTVEMLNKMKLYGMAESLPGRLADARQAELTHAEFVGLLVQDEKTYRENRRLKCLLKKAKLRQQAATEDINYAHARGLKKQVMLEMSSPQWIEAHRNVLLTGPTGIGKSWLACALGNMAARAGYTVLYLRAPRLFETLQQARGDGSQLKAFARLARVQLLILDDFLLTPLSDQQRQDFMEVIEDRYATGSTVITSQFHSKDWHRQIGEPTLSDAICDRLLHNAYKVELKGDSIRKVKGMEKTDA